MARCHICDNVLDKPNFNSLHGDIDPCGVCLEVISNVFGEEREDDPEEAEPSVEELLSAHEDVEKYA